MPGYSTRTELRAKWQAAKDKGKRVRILINDTCFFPTAHIFYFVVWPEKEDTVSLHCDSEMIGMGTREIGATCNVRFGKRVFEGRIANKGKHGILINMKVSLLFMQDFHLSLVG